MSKKLTYTAEEFQIACVRRQKRVDTIYDIIFMENLPTSSWDTRFDELDKLTSNELNIIWNNKGCKNEQ